MEVIYSNQFNKFEGTRPAVAIGSFDGIHLGHQAVINKTIEIAQAKSLAPAVFSFKPHPLEVVAPELVTGFLISQEQKIELLSQLGVDYFFCQKFTRQFAGQDFETFVVNILHDHLNIGHIVVGEDFYFGKGGDGGIDDLIKLGNRYDFGVTSLAPIEKNHEKISSTRIRNLISQGNVDQVKELLGRHYTLAGRVVHGYGRGSNLGFPTANLELDINYVLPAQGVYAGYVHYQDNKYKAVANFGENPTFTNDKYSIEIFILNLQEDLYDKKLKFAPVKFVRGEKKFSSPEKLKEAIQEDVLYTERVLC
ncbi:MAG: bifunctional riboflavin kinase/FAD synthetase [Bacillota bacterium]